MATKESRWTAVAIASIAGGTVVRVVFSVWLHRPVNSLTSDMRGYAVRAIALATGRHLTRFDAFYPPGTHILLALPFKLFGIHNAGGWAGTTLWLIMSCAVPLLAWRIMLRISDPRAAAITAFLCAFWPIYITYGGFFLSETPSITFLLLTMWLAFRVREAEGRGRVILALAAGISAGASLVIRPQLVLNVAIATGTMLGARRTARVVMCSAIGLLIPVGAVLALNAHAAGRFTGISENGGFNFFQGHCPVRGIHTGNPKIGAYDFASPVAVQQDRGVDVDVPDHVAWEQGFFFKLGFECIKTDGIKHVLTLARNVADLGITSVPWPQSDDPGLRRFVRPANLLISWGLPSIVVIAGATVIGDRRRRRAAGRETGDGRRVASGEALLLAHLLCVLPTAIVFYGDPRFRVPYDVFAFGLVAMLISRYWRWPIWRRSHEPDAEAANLSR